MTECPFCGSTNGVQWKDYGYILVYEQKFDGTLSDRECVRMINNTKPPKFCKCVNCGKSLKISEVEK